MATPEDEIKDLRERNTELVQKVQYWKMTAAQRENEKLNLMKEMNELRLKLSRLRSNGNVQAHNLDVALQTASEKALGYLVRASDEIARTMNFTKTYMRERQESESVSPRWSNLGGTPNSEKKDKVHRVPPLMMGGQSIQPVVALSRAVLNTSNPRSTTRSPNQNVTQRALPMHMLQDVYIPLTRIDARDAHNNSMETDTEANNENSTEDLGLDDSDERVSEESQRISEDEEFDSLRRLDSVAEDIEPEDEVETPLRSRSENPLEGPSWLLDTPTDSKTSSAPTNRGNLEPDSTTEPEENSTTPSATVNKRNTTETSRPLPVRVSYEFSPTVRRRKRTSSPPLLCTPRQMSPYSPRPTSSKRNSSSSRILKVVVDKMRLEGGAGGGGGASPAKRAASVRLRFDAPSPNGSTGGCVVVSETTQNESQEPAVRRRGSSPRAGRGDGDDSDCFTQERSAEQDASARDRGGGDRANDRGGGDRANDRGGRGDRASNNATRRDTTQQEDNIQQERASNESNNDSRPTSRQDRDGCPTNRADRDTRLTSRAERDSRPTSRADPNSGATSRYSHDSDSGSGGELVGEGRTRRTRKVVTYTEKPLNSCPTSRADPESRPTSRYDSGSGSRGEGGEGRPRRTRKVVSYKETPLNRKLRR